MAKIKFVKGAALLAFAKRKAAELGLDGKGMKLDELVWKIQEMEGNSTCFKRQEYCTRNDCCWQLSCGAKMES